MKQNDYQLQLGSTLLSFTEYRNATENLFFVRVHGDELEAQITGKWAVKQYGGVFLDINNATRDVFFEINHKKIAFDPNRIFSEEGIKQDLLEHGHLASDDEIAQIQKFSEFVLNRSTRFEHIIALHNNEEFNIAFYLAGGECFGSAQDIHVDPSQHKNDLIIVTHRDDFEACKAHKLNVVLQNKAQADHSGGFSEYCCKKNIRYFNVEYYKGHLDEQKKAVDIIMKIINTQ